MILTNVQHEKTQQDREKSNSISIPPSTTPTQSVPSTNVQPSGNNGRIRKIPVKILRRLDELEENSSNMEERLNSLDASIEEQVHDKVESCIEIMQEELANDSNDRMDDLEDNTNTADLDDLQKELDAVKTDISGLRDYISETRTSLAKPIEAHEVCKQIAKELEDKEGEVSNESMCHSIC